MNGESVMNNMNVSNRVLRILCTMLMSYLLFACAGGGTKGGNEAGMFNQSVEHVYVDSDVEQDFSKAITLLQQDNNEEAIIVLNTVIEREQRLPAPYVNLAIAHNRLGDSKSAEENLISALKLDIGHPVANNELGLLYRKAGKFNAARTAYENAIKRHPDYLPAKKNLGVLCDLYTHDFNCALEQFEEYLELKPDDKTVAIWVVDVKRRLGK
jgi:Flp pilus assembly protein TadD